MALLPGIQQGRQSAGGTPLTAVIGGLVAAKKRRQDEDALRIQEEEALERGLRKLNEQETQKRITDLQKAKAEGAEERISQGQKFGFQRKLEQVKGQEARKTERVKGLFKDKKKGSAADEAFGALGEEEVTTKDDRIEGFRKQLQKGEILIQRGNKILAISENEIQEGDIRL